MLSIKKYAAIDIGSNAVRLLISYIIEEEHTNNKKQKLLLNFFQEKIYIKNKAELSKEIEATKKELEDEYGQVNIDLKDGSYTEIEKEDAE